MNGPGTELTGQVAIVAGASRGIGRQLALELARHGAAVVVAARTVNPRRRLPGTIGETLAAIAEAGGTAIAVQTDVTRREDLEALVAATLNRFGRLDILINNAADTAGESAPIEDYSRDAWLRQFDTNVHAPFTLMALAVARMKAQGEGGVIINMVSSAGDLTEPTVATSTAGLGSMLGYAATKAALSRLTNVLAPELAPHRIAVVAVDPGFTRTELVGLLDQGGLVDAACAHGMDVPVGAILRIITAPDRLAYTGRIVRAARLG